MPLILCAVLALASLVLGNQSFEGYLLIWCATIMTTAIASIVRPLNSLNVINFQMGRRWAYWLYTLAVANFSASAGFFFSWAQPLFALFMLGFAIYWLIPAYRTADKMTGFGDKTPVRL